jgi:hypothetical protein
VRAILERKQLNVQIGHQRSLHRVAVEGVEAWVWAPSGR